MKHNYLQKHFSCLKYLLAIIGLAGIFLTCSSDNGTTPQIDNKKIGSIISAGVIPDNFDGYDEVTKTIFSNYTAGATVTARYVTTNGTGDGSSWPNATNDLQGAIDGIGDANNNHIYVVLVASGKYSNASSYSMKNHVAIIGGFTTNTYERSGETRLDGNNNQRIFTNNELNKSAILYGVTIANGNDFQGGGMYNQSSSPTLINVTFSSNTAALGGGMYNQSSSPTLINVTFSGNRADIGGGMYNENSSSLTLINVTFSGNTAREGGGMANYDSSPTLIEVTFSGNTAIGTDQAGGGGMYNRDSSPTLIGVTFSGNTAFADGGGMYNRDSSPTLSGVTFSRNTATNNGGGMLNQSSSFTLSNVTFFSNTATGYGGGLYNVGDSFSTLSRVTFSGNTATYGGGGMFNAFSTPTLINVTFSGNTAQNGGGMANDRDSSPILIGVTFSENTAVSNGEGMANWQNSSILINTLIWENTNDSEGNRVYYSLIEGATNTANGVITNNPGTLAFDNHGGAVKTYSILAGSEAKDAGAYVRGVKVSNTYFASNVYYSTNSSTSVQWYRASDNRPVDLPTGTEDLTTTDARGYGRAGRPDIGAYEVGGIAP